MVRRHNHYEAAFEDYIRSRGWPYVSVDEKRKAIFGGQRIKSFDFLVYPPDSPVWLVEIKGRKFPYDLKGGRRYWENWVTDDDLNDLTRWKAVFGHGFESVFVFSYWLTGAAARDPVANVHAYRGEHYAFLWLTAEEYQRESRIRSKSWGTVALSAKTFKQLVRPLDSPE